LKYILINKNVRESRKQLFYNSYFDIVKTSNTLEYIPYLLKLSIIIHFNDILNENFKLFIIDLINDKNLREEEKIQIAFWIAKSTLNKTLRTKLNKTLRESNIKNNFINLNIDNNFEKNIRKILYNILLDKEINILCDKYHKNFENVKDKLMNYIPFKLEEDQEGIIIKNIQFLNNIATDDNFKINNIDDILEYFSAIKDNIDIKILSDKQYLENMKKNWIISKIKEKNYNDNITNLLTQKFIPYNFENNIIKNFIQRINIDNENNLINFFKFYEKEVNIRIDILNNI
jgi:hypothetical protein